jgi:hypothetical protein
MGGAFIINAPLLSISVRNTYWHDFLGGPHRNSTHHPQRGELDSITVKAMRRHLIMIRLVVVADWSKVGVERDASEVSRVEGHVTMSL